jgi:outer membrane protein TolC
MEPAPGSAVLRQLKLAEEGARFAEQALEQSTERQKLGTAQPFEVFQAQETYVRAMLSYLDVVNNYNKAQYSLYVALGNDL